MGQLLNPSDQDDLLAGIVSQADVLSILSKGHRDVSGRKTTKSAETSSRPSGTSRASSPSATSSALRTTNCTRPYTLEWLIWAPTATLTNR
jgi:hypothetical protein